MSPSFFSLELRELILMVRLGYSKDERSTPQEIKVSFELRFPRCPEAIVSDRLEDTVCYARISEAFRAWCEGREWAMLEKLAFDLYQKAREISGPEVQVSLRAHKVAPPIEGLSGGVVCRIGDFG